MMDIFKDEITEILLKAIQNIDIETNKELISETIESPPDPRLGDMSSNLPFKLAKNLRKSPKDIASIIKDQINPINHTLLKNVELAGGGYINFFFEPNEMVNRVVFRILEEKDNFGSVNLGKNRKMVVEHTAINPTKPLHIGHLRNAVLGDSIARIQEKCGWKVEIQNYIDDMGQQMAVLIWAMRIGLHHKISSHSAENFDVWLGRVYCEGAEKVKSESREAEVADVLREMKEGQDLFSFSRQLAEKCVLWNLRTVWRLDVLYDLLFWESDVALSEIWEKTYSLLKQNPNFDEEIEGENKGCFVARLSHLDEFKGDKSPNKILVRSNGLPTYVAHDIALQMWKFGLVEANVKFQDLFTQKTPHTEKSRKLWSSTPLLGEISNQFGSADLICNVIGTEQDYLQKIVKLTFRLFGDENKYEKSFHLSYKHVKLPGERFSGRVCNWYYEKAWADAVIDSAIEIATETARSKRNDLSPAKWREIGEIIGTGAVRYWLLKFSPETEIIFIKEDATSLEGDTAPFLVYSLIRCRGILKKTEETKFEKNDPNLAQIQSEAELTLVRSLAAYPGNVRDASMGMKPSILTAYSFELASIFNKFYEKCPVLTAPTKGLINARLHLVQATTIVLENVLELLGIPIPSEM